MSNRNKWRVYRLGYLKVVLNELRSYHTCAAPHKRASITYSCNAIYWKGTQKYLRIKRLECL